MSDPALPPGFVEQPPAGGRTPSPMQAGAPQPSAAPPLPPGFIEGDPGMLGGHPYLKAGIRGVVSGIEGLTKLGVAATYLTPPGMIDMALNDNLPFKKDEQGNWHFRNPLDKDPIRKGFWDRADHVEQTTNKAFPNIKGEGNDYGKSIAEGVGSAIATPAGGIPKSLVMGGLSGAGGQLGEDVAGPAGRAVGSLLGATAGGIGSFFLGAEKGGTVARARDALKDIPDEKLKEAQSFMETARSKGVQLDPAQALTAVGADSSGVTALRNYLLGTDAGRKLQNMLMQQPGQLSLLKDAAIGSLPGEVKDVYTAGRQLGSAADARIGIDKAAVAQTAQEFKDTARAALEASAKMTVAQANSVLEGTNMTLEKARKSLARSLSQIEKQKSLYDSNQWLRNIPENQQDLADRIAKHVAKEGKIPGFQDEVSAAEKGLLEAKRQAGKMLQSREPEQGYDRIVKAGSPELRATTSGPVGTIGHGYDASKPANAVLTKFDSLLEAGTSPQAKISPIRQLGAELAKTPDGKEAFADGLKTALDKRYAKAFGEELGVAGPTTTPDTVKQVAAVLGNSAQEQGLKDAISLVAEHAGKDPNAVVKGYEIFRQIVKGTANRKDIPGASPEAITAGASKTLIGRAVRPFSSTERLFGDRNLKEVMGKFSIVMTSPDGIDMLRRLAKSRPPEYAAILQGFLGAQRGVDAAQHKDGE